MPLGTKHKITVALLLFLSSSWADLNRHPKRSGIVYWHGDSTKNIIALTFDDGPNEPYTSEILKILKDQNIRATFFVVGENVEKYPSLLKKELAAGHAIGNHSWSHPDMIFETEGQVGKQLMKTEADIERVTGRKPTIFRPPFGADDPFTFHESEKLGYVAVKWSVSSRDWERPGVQKIINYVLTQVQNGSIILMHDGNQCHGGDRSQTVEALKTIIPELKARGFKFVTVPELLSLKQ